MDVSGAHFDAVQWQFALNSGKNYVSTPVPCNIESSSSFLLFFMIEFNFGGIQLCIIGLRTMNKKNHNWRFNIMAIAPKV